MPASSTADIETVVALCRLDLGTQQSADAPVYQWGGVIDVALRHGLIGPLQSAVSKMHSVPDSLFSTIQSVHLNCAARNFQLLNALFEVLAAFRECGTELCVLKGPAVALLAYGQITTREFTDLDLLIRHEDLDRAEGVLAQLGYLRANHVVGRFHSEKDIQFLRASDDVLVELHWALNAPTRRFPVEETGIWNRRQTLYFQNDAIPTLGVEDTLINLCIHGSVHGWSSLKWIFDIARLLSSKSVLVDWDSLIERCRTVGCERILIVNLRLAFVFFGVKPPDAIAAQILEDKSITALVERFRNAILCDVPLSPADLALCHVQLHDRFWDRLLVAYRYLPAPGQITVGPRRFISRPVRLFNLYGLAWLRMALTGR